MSYKFRWFGIVSFSVVVTGLVYIYAQNSKAEDFSSALFPAPDDPEKPGQGIMQLLHAESAQAAEETAIEQELTYNDFDPLDVPAALLRKEFLPPGGVEAFRKKLDWWPYWEGKGKIVRKRGAGTAVARYSVGDYTIQINSKRDEVAIYVHGDGGPLNLTPSKVAKEIPQSFIDVFQEQIFEKTKPVFIQEAKLENGGTFSNYLKRANRC